MTLTTVIFVKHSLTLRKPDLKPEGRGRGAEEETHFTKRMKMKTTNFSIYILQRKCPLKQQLEFMKANPVFLGWWREALDCQTSTALSQ